MIDVPSSAFPIPTVHGQDAYARGVNYLRGIHPFLIDPAMVDVMENVRDRTAICTWIGNHILAVNAALEYRLQACHDCFYPQERRPIQIFAVPLTASLGLDGVCNLSTTPITLLIDPGRVAPADWLGVVAHEYAHAHAGSPGHHPTFAAILAHLCLGLGFPPPIDQQEETLRNAPPCRSVLNSLAFWRGETEDLNPEWNRRDRPGLEVS